MTPNDRARVAPWLQPLDILLDAQVDDGPQAIDLMASAAGRVQGLESAPLFRALMRLHSTHEAFTCRSALNLGRFGALQRQSRAFGERRARTLAHSTLDRTQSVRIDATTATASRGRVFSLPHDAELEEGARSLQKGFWRPLPFRDRRSRCKRRSDAFSGTPRPKARLVRLDCLS